MSSLSSIAVGPLCRCGRTLRFGPWSRWVRQRQWPLATEWPMDTYCCLASWEIGGARGVSCRSHRAGALVLSVRKESLLRAAGPTAWPARVLEPAPFSVGLGATSPRARGTHGSLQTWALAAGWPTDTRCPPARRRSAGTPAWPAGVPEPTLPQLIWALLAWGRGAQRVQQTLALAT